MDEGRGFTIIDYEDRYKQALEDISLPWLLEYDLLEPVDLEMLAEPHRFLSGGGRVLLARWGEEIVGMVMLASGEGPVRAAQVRCEGGIPGPGHWYGLDGGGAPGRPGCRAEESGPHLQPSAQGGPAAV